MNETTWERWGAASGFAALLAGAAGGMLEPTWPGGDDPATIAAFVADHQGVLLTQSIVFVISSAIFLWFLGSLRGFLIRAEARTGRLASVAFGAGLTWVVINIVGQAPQISQVLAARRAADPGTVVAMGDLAFTMLGLANLPLAVMMAAVAVATLRTGAFPAWLGWLAAAVGVASLALVFGVIAESGPLARNGLLTYALYPAFAVWLIPVTIMMIIRLGRPVPTALVPRPRERVAPKHERTG